MRDNANSGSQAIAGLGQPMSETARCAGVFTVQCHDPDGNLVWEEEFHNLWTTVGKNNTLDNQMAGSAWTAAWYVGLITSTGYTTGPAAGDTSASHSGWAESQNYSQGTRPSAAWNSASGGTKALSSAAVFTMNATDTIKGAFLISNSTKGGATGTLFSAGTFSGGDQPVISGNSLSVNYSVSIT